MANITQEEFDNELAKILNETNAITLLTIPGVYELLAEEFNNVVIENIEQRREDG
jgi:hypothetical protein